MAKIPQAVQYIKDTLDKDDIERVWNYLGKTFGFNSGKWKADFNSFIQSLPRDRSVEEAFILFGKEKIEPLLNEILKRKQYPTWIELLSFVLKDKIDEKRKRDKRYKKRYE